MHNALRRNGSAVVSRSLSSMPTMLWKSNRAVQEVSTNISVEAYDHAYLSPEIDHCGCRPSLGILVQVNMSLSRGRSLLHSQKPVQDQSHFMTTPSRLVQDTSKLTVKFSSSCSVRRSPPRQPSMLPAGCGGSRDSFWPKKRAIDCSQLRICAYG